MKPRPTWELALLLPQPPKRSDHSWTPPCQLQQNISRISTSLLPPVGSTNKPAVLEGGTSPPILLAPTGVAQGSEWEMGLPRESGTGRRELLCSGPDTSSDRSSHAFLQTPPQEKQQNLWGPRGLSAPAFRVLTLLFLLAVSIAQTGYRPHHQGAFALTL